mgnify:CR=1 FL=1
MKKMLFIYNPKAGKAQIRNKLADILDVFTKGGYEITVYPTQRSEDAMRSAAKNMISWSAAAETERWMRWSPA